MIVVVTYTAALHATQSVGSIVVSVSTVAPDKPVTSSSFISKAWAKFAPVTKPVFSIPVPPVKGIAPNVVEELPA